MSVPKSAAELGTEAFDRKLEELAGRGLSSRDLSGLASRARDRAISETAKRIEAGEFDCYVRQPPGGELVRVDRDHPLMIELRAFVANRCEWPIGFADATRINFADLVLARRRDTWTAQAGGNPRGPITERVVQTIEIDRRWTTDLLVLERVPEGVNDAGVRGDDDEERADEPGATPSGKRDASIVRIRAEAIAATASLLGFDPQRLATADKDAIRSEAGSRFPSLFAHRSKQTFHTAWHYASSHGLIGVLDAEKFTKGRM